MLRRNARADARTLALLGHKAERKCLDVKFLDVRARFSLEGHGISGDSENGVVADVHAC